MKTRIIKIFLLLLLIGYLFRVFALNKKFNLSKEECYKIGETVELGNNFFDSNEEKMDSYSLTVLDAKLMTMDDFNNEYIGEINYSGDSNDYIYLIRIKFRNNSNDVMLNSGIDLMQYIFQESSYTNLVEASYLKYLNDFNVTKFSLRANSEKEIMIPFKIISRNVDIKQIKNGKPTVPLPGFGLWV